MKKSFWLYPIAQKEFTSNEKEEADLLTTFGITPLSALPTRKGLDQPLPFITEFFANHTAAATSMFSFILNKNELQEAYCNPYNPAGVRYFFCCLFSDFEQVKYIDKHKNICYKVETCQCLYLLETKYPFAGLFRTVLTHLFNVVRLKRLEFFSQNYNGNERDVANLEFIKHYDASSILSVVAADGDPP